MAKKRMFSFTVYYLPVQWKKKSTKNKLPKEVRLLCVSVRCCRIDYWTGMEHILFLFLYCEISAAKNIYLLTFFSCIWCKSFLLLFSSDCYDIAFSVLFLYFSTHGLIGCYFLHNYFHYLLTRNTFIFLTFFQNCYLTSAQRLFVSSKFLYMIYLHFYLFTYLFNLTQYAASYCWFTFSKYLYNIYLCLHNNEIDDHCKTATIMFSYLVHFITSWHS